MVVTIDFMSLKSTEQRKNNLIFMFAFEACYFLVFLISQFVVVHAKIASEPGDEFTIESINGALLVFLLCFFHRDEVTRK